MKEFDLNIGQLNFDRNLLFMIVSLRVTRPCNIQIFLKLKKKRRNFLVANLMFSYFAQYMDCGYTFAEAVLTSTHNLSFFEEK